MKAQHMKESGHINYNRLQASSLVFLALIALGALLNMTASFMVPFVIAVLFSFLIVPAADFMERHRVPSFFANLVIILGIFFAITAMGFIVYGALHSVSSQLPRYGDKLKLILKSGADLLGSYVDPGVLEQQDDFPVEKLLRLFSPAAMMKTINQSVGGFLTFLSKSILMLVFLIFILVGRKVLIDKVLRFFHAREINPEGNFAVASSISRQIRTYLWMKTVISIATGGVFGLAAWLLGVDFALIWGFLAFLLSYIPTLGAIISTVPPAALCFLQFDNIWWAVFSALTLTFIQFVSGNIVEPKIMGDRMNLNVITILLSLFLWGLIWGLPGMLLAVPITAAVNIIFANVPRLRPVSILLGK